MILKLLVGIPAVAAGLIAAGLLALLQGGIATVRIQDPEMSLYLPVPMAAFDVALAFVPEQQLARVRQDLEPHRELILAALEELADCPDAVLVDVRNSTESVLVSKVGDELWIWTREGNSTVEVRIPLRSVRRVAASLAG